MTVPDAVGRVTVNAPTGSASDQVGHQPSATLAPGRDVATGLVGPRDRTGDGSRVPRGGVATDTPVATAVDAAHDRLVRSADRRTTTFRFTNYGGADGLDFTAGCSSTVTVPLYADGHLVAPERIHLGAKAPTAMSNPVRLTGTPTARRRRRSAWEPRPTGQAGADLVTGRATSLGS